MARRTGRGRLSSIDLLPEAAEPAVARAMAELAGRDRTQEEILHDLNAELMALDPPCDPISRSAFNRHSLRFSAQARKLREARETAAALAERLEDMPEGDIGLMLAETIKTVLNDLLLDKVLADDAPSVSDLRAAAEAIQRLSIARKNDHDVQERARKAVMAKAAEAVDLAVAQGKIDVEAARAAREVMGFA